MFARVGKGSLRLATGNQQNKPDQSNSGRAVEPYHQPVHKQSVS
jgi:hypothetical protein